MSRALLVRSIPLSSDTRNAWKDAGAVFARRDRNTQQILEIRYDRPIINLGASWFGPDEEGIWNKGTNVKSLLTPALTRLKFGTHLPTNRWVGPDKYWLKGPGRAGNNKTLHNVRTYDEFNELVSQARWIDGDVQLHIDGQEYRVITVGNKIVQGMERHGENGQREYRWVGVNGLPSSIKRRVKQCNELLDGDNIIGWDGIVHDSGDAFVFEGNSCPGVNSATAGRILDAVEGISYG